MTVRSGGSAGRALPATCLVIATGNRLSEEKLTQRLYLRSICTLPPTFGEGHCPSTEWSRVVWRGVFERRCRCRRRTPRGECRRLRARSGSKKSRAVIETGPKVEAARYVRPQPTLDHPKCTRMLALRRRLLLQSSLRPIGLRALATSAKPAPNVLDELDERGFVAATTR